MTVVNLWFTNRVLVIAICMQFRYLFSPLVMSGLNENNKILGIKTSGSLSLVYLKSGTNNDYGLISKAHNM